MSKEIRLLATMFLVANICVTSATHAQTPAAKLHQLRLDRRDTLQERFEVVKVEYEIGRVPFSHVLAAENDLLAASLVLATDSTERMVILEKAISNRKQIEDYERLRIEAGQARQHDLLFAKIQRLQAEIDLLRERRAAK